MQAFSVHKHWLNFFCEKVINGGSSLEYLVHLGHCDICRTGSTCVLLPKVAKVSIATVMPRFENIANVNATFVALFWNKLTRDGSTTYEEILTFNGLTKTCSITKSSGSSRTIFFFPKMKISLTLALNKKARVFDHSKAFRKSLKA
jgi:hypothetical protein